MQPESLVDVMLELGVAIDGGKDSLSMAALAPGPDGYDETVTAPGALVVSAYVTCPDVTRVVTPDLKHPDEGRLLFVDLSGGKEAPGRLCPGPGVRPDRRHATRRGRPGPA